LGNESRVDGAGLGARPHCRKDVPTSRMS
jgi:hypothetical protein